jgi:hypothetical protein
VGGGAVSGLLELWRRLLARPAPANPSPGYSYRIYWTKTTWNWPGEKRERVLARVKELISADDFIQSPYERLYRIDELGEGEYSGESLNSLAEVLAAFAKIDQEGVEE